MLDLRPEGSFASNTANLVMDLTGEVQGAFGALDVIDSNNKAMQILGFSASLAALTGPITAHNGLKEYRVSKLREDVWGQVRGVMKMAEGGFETAGGVAFTGMSIATIRAFQTASKTAVKAASIFGTVGMGLMGGAALSGLSSSILSLSYLTSARAKVAKWDDPIKEIRKECKDPVLSLEWHRVLGEELLEKVLTTDGVTLSDLQEKFREDYCSAIFGLMLQVAGITLSALAVVASGGLAPWVIGVFGALLGLIALVLDSQSFFETLEKRENTPLWEQAMVLITACFCFATTLIGLYYAEELFSIAFTALAGLLLTGIHIYGFAKMRSNGADS